MKSSQVSNESDSYDSQHSKNGQKDGKQHIRYVSTKHSQGSITGSQVGRVRAVETNTLSIGKVDNEKGQAIEEQ